MEKYISKSALVAEIDRQKIGYNVDGKHSVEYDTIRKILNILNTLEVKEGDLEKKPVSNAGEICNECRGHNNKDKCDELVFGHKCPIVKEPVSEDLEEACEQLAENARKHKAETISPFFSPTDYKQGVIDGAKWKEQQMMAKAVDGEVGYWNQRGLSVLMSLPREFEEDDKCKIILIKEE